MRKTSNILVGFDICTCHKCLTCRCRWANVGRTWSHYLPRSSVRPERTPGRPGETSMILSGDRARVLLRVGPLTKMVPLSRGTRPLLGYSVTIMVVYALAWPQRLWCHPMAHSWITWGLHPLGPCSCYPLTLGRLSQYALVLTPLKVLGMMMSLPCLRSLLPQRSVFLPQGRSMSALRLDIFLFYEGGQSDTSI